MNISVCINNKIKKNWQQLKIAIETLNRHLNDTLPNQNVDSASSMNEAFFNRITGNKTLPQLEYLLTFPRTWHRKRSIDIFFDFKNASSMHIIKKINQKKNRVNELVNDTLSNSELMIFSMLDAIRIIYRRSINYYVSD